MGGSSRSLFNYTPGSLSVYVLVNAVNATTEGVLGTSSSGQTIPLPGSPCGPMP